MSSTRQALVLAVASLTVLALGLIGLELVFGHWLERGDWSRVDRLNVVRDRRVQYDVRHIHGPDAPPVTYTRDRYGLRGDCPSPADIRVLTIGGSTTDQVYVSDGQTWQDQLQRRLRGLAGGQRWCVANAGVDGHTTFGHIAALEQWLPLIPGLKPEYYLLYIGVNDAALRLERASGDNRGDAAPAGVLGRVKQAIKHNSALFGLWRRLAAARPSDGPVFAAHRLISPTDETYTSTRPADDIAALVDESTASFRTRLQRLLQLVAIRGGKPICVSQPSIIYRRFEDGWRGIPSVFSARGRRFNGLDYRQSMLALNAAMEQDCPAAGGYYLDLESRAFDVSDFYDGVHMNAAGARKVGDYLFAEFVRQGIALPDSPGGVDEVR